MVEALGKAYGFRPVFFWQPVIFFKSHRVPFEEEEAAKYAWASTTFDEVKTLLSGDTHLKSDAAFLDLSEAFEDADSLVFLDFCHTTEEANASSARVVTRLLEIGVVTSPAPSHRQALRPWPPV